MNVSAIVTITIGVSGMVGRVKLKERCAGHLTTRYSDDEYVAAAVYRYGIRTFVVAGGP
jgi:hypothetical protein